MIRQLVLTGILSLAVASAGAEEGHGGGGSRHSSRAARPSQSRTVFNKYPQRNTTKTAGGREAVAREAIPAHPDAFGNRVTEDHLQRVEFASQRAANTMKMDAHIQNSVAFSSAAFASTMHPVYQRRVGFYNEQFIHYNSLVLEHPVYWQTWHQHFFYGGFYYGFHPCPDINIYFYNPMVHWFYVSTWDPHYYHVWYADEYQASPQLDRPFEYFGVYYPTDNLRQLLFGVSGMSVEKQNHFRLSMIPFTQKVAQQLANVTHQHVALSKGDIVVTHYEILGYDDAVVMEGFVTHQNQTYNFKGLIGLESQPEEQVFLAGTNDSPSPTELQNLDILNRSINDIRGETTNVVASPAPGAVAAPTPSGEVSADPQKQ